MSLHYWKWFLASLLLVMIVGTIGSLQPAEPVGAAHLAPNSNFTIFLPLTMNQSNGLQKVSLQNIAYHPGSITVQVGTQISWTNNEPDSFIQHTVTSGTPGAPNGVFGSPILSPGQSFQFTFATAGTFSYFCQIHGAAMTGTVIVTP